MPQNFDKNQGFFTKSFDYFEKFAKNQILHLSYCAISKKINVFIKKISLVLNFLNKHF